MLCCIILYSCIIILHCNKTLISVGLVLQHYVSELEHIRNSYAGLSVSKRGEVEDLLMEGDLLEVTMDEVRQLWHLIQEDSDCQVAFEKTQEYVDHDEGCIVRY